MPYHLLCNLWAFWLHLQQQKGSMAKRTITHQGTTQFLALQKAAAIRQEQWFCGGKVCEGEKKNKGRKNGVIFRTEANTDLHFTWDRNAVLQNKYFFNLKSLDVTWQKIKWSQWHWNQSKVQCSLIDKQHKFQRDYFQI